MSKIAIKYLSIVLSIYALSQIIDTIEIGSIPSLLFLGLSLLLVNMILKPILHLLTFPFTIITLGLFTFVVNAWTIMLADFFVPRIEIGSFLNALLCALVITVMNHVLVGFNKKDE